MRDYVIINGTNSNTITGLAINLLPPISKPPLRVMTEEIDGRDGDLITDLGYGSYDKTMTISLWGSFNIDTIIGFFNSEGTIVFSNEPDKYYNFKIINQIDYEKLLKFKTAEITLHCQPFKYPLVETPIEIINEYVDGEGENINLNNTKASTMKIDLKGNTTQNGTPTPSSPIDVNVVSGDNEVVVCGKNLYKSNTSYTWTSSNTTWYFINGSDGAWGSNMGDKTELKAFVKNGTTYTIGVNISGVSGFELRYGDETGLYPTWNEVSGRYTATFTANKNGVVVLRAKVNNGDTCTISNLMFVEGNQAQTYEPYTGQNYPLYLGVENLFNYLTTPIASSGSTDIQIETITDGIKLTSKSTNTWVNARYLIMNIEKYPNGKVTLSSNINGTYTNARRINIVSCDSTGNNRTVLNSIETTLNGYFTATATLPSTFTSTNNYLMLVFYSSAGTAPTVGNYVEYTNIQLELGSKANSYTPYGTMPIELNKIGTYQDYIYKTDKWYLHKEVGKVVLDGSESWATWYQTSNSNIGFYYSMSGLAKIGVESDYNGALWCDKFSEAQTRYDIYIGTSEAIKQCGGTGSQYIALGLAKTNLSDWSTSTNAINSLKTWLGNNNVIVYYVLQTPTNTEITDANLINQLESLKGAMSYEGQTNISQVNNDLPFILKVKGTKEGSGEGIINNIGNIYAKPIIALEGTGNIGIYKNGTQYFEVDMSSDNEITIDTEKMEAYHNGVLKNRKVIGDYNKFTIDEGNNNIEITGELTKATISNYTRWL